MSSPIYTLDFAPSPTQSAAIGWRGLKRVWGVVCGLTFLATRGSIYLLVLPFTAIACVTGMALCGLQALTGAHRG